MLKGKVENGVVRIIHPTPVYYHVTDIKLPEGFDYKFEDGILTIIPTPVTYTEEEVKGTLDIFHAWFWKSIKNVEFNWSTKNGAPSVEDFWNDKKFWNEHKKK